MKLQILVPQYEEDETIVKPLLDSIAIQQSIDFSEIGVIIVNDGSNVHLSEDFLNSYPFTIEYYLNKHLGVSATRQAALDKATADYVMFCDADDMFCNICGLYLIINEMKNGVFDSLVSVFIEETRNPLTNEVLYMNREMDSTFVHGKVHRRRYLIEKNIKWNPNLTIHEDSFFNIQCQSLSQNVKYCPFPFYLWKWRDDSVCRHDPKYILRTYRNMIDSNTALIEEFKHKGRPDLSAFYTVFMIFDAYYTMNKPEWIDMENQEYRDATEKYFANYYRTHKKDWENFPYQEKMNISQSIRGRNVQEGMHMETMTVDEWLKHVEDLVKE